MLEGEALFRLQFESCNLGMAIAPAEGPWLHANSRLCGMLGYSEAELRQKARAELVHPDDLAADADHHRRLLAGELPACELDQRFLRKDGSVLFVHLTAACSRAPDGSPRFVVSTLTDLSDRVATEEALRQSQSLLNGVFRSVPTGIGVVSRRIIQWTNDRLAEMTGYTAAEMAGQSARMLYPTQEDFDYVGREKYAQIAVHDTGAVETRWLRKDGRVIDVLLSSTPLDPANLDAGVVFTALDITDRKQAETERLDLERRLLHAQKLESLGTMAGGIAHDFNNLLMAILGNLDVALLDLSPNSPARARIGQAMQAVRRATDLTRQMLAYSGQGRFLVVRMDLSQLVRESAELFRAAIPKSVTLDVSLTAEPTPIDADPGQVQQVIMSLITNAAEAIADRPGAVALGTGVLDCDDADLAASRIDEKPGAGRFVLLEVSDNGCGMDEHAQQRLFDPFFTTKFTGRGLGLSAVLGIVRSHGGAILVDSTPQQGTKVRVLFPACEAPAGAAPAAAPRRVPAPAPKAGEVLVVDDEDAVRGLCAAFVEHLGYAAIQAGDGEEALRLFEQHADRIACVLLDLTMPRLDGVHAFREMKRRWPDVPVVLSSGYDQQDATRSLIGEDLAGFIQKPYRFQELKDVLDRVVRRIPGSVP